MAFVGRLIVRLIVVPIAAVLAIVAGVVVSFVANWNQLGSWVSGPPDDPNIIGGLLLAAAWASVVALSSAKMLLPGAIGILVSEVFVLRSWIFHVLNGAVSMWVGWWTIVKGGEQADLHDNPLIVLAVGLVAGFVYWAIAGWNAGLFTPAAAGPPGPPTPATPR